MDNVDPEGTEDQYITYPDGEDFSSNVYVGRSELSRNIIQRFMNCAA